MSPPRSLRFIRRPAPPPLECPSGKRCAHLTPAIHFRDATRSSTRACCGTVDSVNDAPLLSSRERHRTLLTVTWQGAHLLRGACTCVRQGCRTTDCHADRPEGALPVRPLRKTS